MKKDEHSWIHSQATWKMGNEMMYIILYVLFLSVLSLIGIFLFDLMKFLKMLRNMDPLQRKIFEEKRAQIEQQWNFDIIR